MNHHWWSLWCDNFNPSLKLQKRLHCIGYAGLESVKGVHITYLLFQPYTHMQVQNTWSFTWSFTIYLIKSLLSWSKDGDHQLWSLNIGRCTCFLRKPLIIVWKLCFDQKNVCCHHLTWTCIKTLAGWPKAHQVSGKGLGVAQHPQIWLSRYAKKEILAPKNLRKKLK